MSLSDVALVNLTQAKAYLRVDASASLRIDAEYVGVGNGVAVEFDLDNTPVEGSLKLFVDGALQAEDTDFTISGSAITFTAAPVLNKGITASYDYVAGDDTFESYDDELLETLIAAATKKAEDYCGRVFIQRKIAEIRLGDGTQTLKLYKQPVVSIDTITIGGTELTTYSQRLAIGRIYHSIVWPLDYEVVVTYQAGSAETRAAVQALLPDAMTAVLLIISDLYENRGDKIDSVNISGLGSTSFKLPSRAEELLNPLRMSVL